MTVPIRRKRVPYGLSRTRFVVGGVVIAAIVAIPLAVIFYTFVYAVSGPSLPYLINSSGPEKGPASLDDRLQAAALCAGQSAVMLMVIRQWVRNRVRAPGVTVDWRGMWLVRGERHVQQGLAWPRIAAVNIVTGDEETSVPAEAASPPFVEVFTVDAIKESRSPLAARVVNAPPAAHGLRGKRYVIELTGPPDAVTELAAAVDQFASGTLLDR